MSLKRTQRPELEAEPTLSAGASPRASAGKARRSRPSRRTLSSASSGESSSSTASSSSTGALASAPRTVEIMWNGRTAPGFTLKRKRTGAILVSTVTEATRTATTLRAGSELKLVGGFPVNRLTLQDVKKVMLLAPRPVSLVFVNCEDVVLRPSHGGSFVLESSHGRGSLVNEFASLDAAAAGRKLSSASTSAEQASTCASSVSAGSVSRSVSLGVMESEASEDEDTRSTASAPAPAFYSKPSENNKSKKRKVSKLQVALDRMNQLLNRPVRQSGLNVSAGKSIVV